MKLKKKHVTKSSVFDDLELDPAEEMNAKIRVSLIRAIEQELDKMNVTQAANNLCD